MDARSPSFLSRSQAGETFRAHLTRALDRRKPFIQQARAQAFRAFSGAVDGVEGVFVDVYGPGAVLIVYEGTTPRWFDPAVEAATVRDVLKPIGVQAVYVKPFARDRSRLGGELPACVTDPKPAAGEMLPEFVLIREINWTLEVRLYDGLSTGLFLDQRENRGWVHDWVKARIGNIALPRPLLPPFSPGAHAGSSQRPESNNPAWAPGLNGANKAETRAAPSVLNTFAYTCAFSIAGATAGATTTSVDVSGRYLDWGKRSFSHNGLDAAQHRFAKMDTFEFFGYAGRKGMKYDLIILDPPSFASGSKKKGIRPWSSVEDYARLVREASRLLHPKGVIFASTNTQELCRQGRLEREIVKGLGREPKWVKLPDEPMDFAREKDRFAARAFGV